MLTKLIVVMFASTLLIGCISINRTPPPVAPQRQTTTTTTVTPSASESTTVTVTCPAETQLYSDGKCR
jgi:hypothetical protein